MKGSILYTIIQSSLLISVSKIALVPNGNEVNNKLNRVIYQSSIMVCPVKLQKNPKIK